MLGARPQAAALVALLKARASFCLETGGKDY
jgi:hypothetical protein